MGSPAKVSTKTLTHEQTAVIWMVVNSSTFLPSIVFANKKDDEDILSTSLDLSLNLNYLSIFFELPNTFIFRYIQNKWVGD